MLPLRAQGIEEVTPFFMTGKTEALAMINTGHSEAVRTSAFLMLWSRGHCQPWPLMQTVNTQQHLRCLGTMSCEHSTRADFNISA